MERDLRFVLLAASTLIACGRAEPPVPELAIVGESTRVRLESPRPAKTAWFDGASVSLVAARGEVLGLKVIHRTVAPASLAIPGIAVAGFDVDSYYVPNPSTAMYG